MTASDIAAFLPPIILVVVLGFMLFVVRSHSHSHPDFDPYTHDDNRFWILGTLYYNPDDPRVLVPKRYFAGYTLNLARPLGQTILISILIVVAGSLILGMVSSGSGTPIGCHPSGCHW